MRSETFEFHESELDLLIGTWRSDQALTVGEWLLRPEEPRGSLERVARQFGKLTLRYTGTHLHSEFEGIHRVCEYWVAARDNASVAIVCLTDDGQEIRHVHFADPDTYWVSLGGNREFFRRICR